MDDADPVTCLAAGSRVSTLALIVAVPSGIALIAHWKPLMVELANQVMSPGFVPDPNYA
ncbi:hypothetical protein [Mycobacterium leprae]|uniref:hypothetical protein n=1 Tax=Mycobacterium leprae TaxID=1769 RepID=UPI000A72C6B2|nr:hypothetical protein [Mycobacterium leprae]